MLDRMLGLERERNQGSQKCSNICKAAHAADIHRAAGWAMGRNSCHKPGRKHITQPRNMRNRGPLEKESPCKGRLGKPCMILFKEKRKPSNRVSSYSREKKRNVNVTYTIRIFLSTTSSLGSSVERMILEVTRVHMHLLSARMVPSLSPWV